MKIFVAQQNYHIGNIKSNTKKIIQAITDAKKEGGDLIIFSELAVCGYPPRDLLDYQYFIDECLKAISIIQEEADNIAVLVGCPSINPQAEGKDLFNSAYFLYGRKVQQIIHKTLLPNYDIFDEYRHFEPAYEWNIIEFKNQKIAVTICEDIWDMDKNPMYRIKPMDYLKKFNPDFMINISASPFDYHHAEERKAVIQSNTLKYQLPIIYCNCVGSQTEIVFDGGSLICNAHGKVIKELPYFQESIVSISLQEIKQYNEGDVILHYPDINLDTTPFNSRFNIDRVHDALVLSIKEYFSKMGFQKALISSSGGIDSAVTLALACRALGSENVHAVLLPSQFSTEHSITDAKKLSDNLGNPYDIVPIKDIFYQFESSLNPIFQNLPFDVTEENIQARIRGVLAMALSNKFNYILLNTSNKSELAIGYGTLYGDMAGGLGVLGDVYKMQVYALAEYINKDKEIIPLNIIRKPPSAELRENQKDTDSLPEYDILDEILFQYIDQRKSPDEIINPNFESHLVHKIINMVNKNEYKRHQFCPIIRISSKSFGIGRRIPIVAKYEGRG